jgi:2-oxoglutarate dehydrogenase complex dehydrogenase (E1) component-like enzyme
MLSLMLYIYALFDCAQLRYIGRPVSAIPATGVGEVHQKESRDIIESIFVKV